VRDLPGNLDGFVKSPSAALRFNFVVAAHPESALHASVFARLASGAFYETIVPTTFYEIINLLHFLILGEPEKEINTVNNVFFCRIYPIF
jgi:hypothetical protein